jgi:hypothetical protein
MSRGGVPEDREVRERLRALRVDPPEGDFPAALRRRLVAAGPPRAPSPWWRLLELVLDRRVLWPAAGLAAGVAAFLALSPGRPPPSPVVGREAAVVPVTRVAVVRLTLSADVPVDAARIRVTLPPQLSFWSDGRALAQRSFEWTQPLAAGDNEIPIAVRGERPGRYRIAVDAHIGAETVEDEVVIEVVSG